MEIPKGTGTFEVHPEEEGEGIVLGYFDHGIQTHPKYGDKHKVALKIMSTTHTYEAKWEEDGNEMTETRPFVISQKVNLATGKRSTLYKLRKRLLGRDLSQKENDDLRLVTEDSPESQGWAVKYEVEHGDWTPPDGGEKMTFANLAFVKVTDKEREITDSELKRVREMQTAITKRVDEANDDGGVPDDPSSGGDLDQQVIAGKFIDFLFEEEVYDAEKAENYKAFIKDADADKLKTFIARCERAAANADVEVPEGVYDDLPF